MRSSLMGRSLAVLLAACFGVFNVGAVGVDACAMHGAHHMESGAATAGSAIAAHLMSDAPLASHASMSTRASDDASAAPADVAPEDCTTAPCTCPGMCSAAALIALVAPPVFETRTVLAQPAPTPDAPEVIAAFRRRLLPPATAPPMSDPALLG